MDSIMFVATFVLGAIVLLVAIIALLKGKARGGGGSLEFGGFKLAGTGAPSIFLLTGVDLMLSGVNGYAAIERTQALQTENNDLVVDNNSLSDSVSAVKVNLQEERTRTRLLLTKISPQALQSLRSQNATLFAPSALHNPGAATLVNPGDFNH
jgi:hypothetical protein